jgi:hypothetical protein
LWGPCTICFVGVQSANSASATTDTVDPLQGMSLCRTICPSLLRRSPLAVCLRFSGEHRRVSSNGMLQSPGPRLQSSD